MDADALLGARLVAGDDDALSEALDRYGPLVYGLARRVTASAALAEDITQDVFVELWRRPERFDPKRGSLRTFLAVQAHRRSVDAVRSETRRAKREALHHGFDQEERVVFARSEPEDSAERSLLVAEIREAVNHLPVEQRIVIELAYFGGCTHREIALELGIPEGTAKSRMRLAQKRLKPLLERELIESAQ